MKTATALACLLALAACHNQPTAGGLTPEEERELDNAAAMLDQQNIFDTAPEDMDANQSEAPGNDAAPAPAPAPAPPAANQSGNRH